MTEQPIEALLAELEALLQAADLRKLTACKSKWHENLVHSDYDWPDFKEEGYDKACVAECRWPTDGPGAKELRSPKIAALFAFGINALPRLIAEIRRLRAEVKEHEDRLEDARYDHHGEDA